MNEILKIKPDSNCESCNGTGEVTDWVPYGMGEVPMTSLCDCVTNQVPEGKEDLEVELVFDRE